jgi:hypothetical protein
VVLLSPSKIEKATAAFFQIMKPMSDSILAASFNEEGAALLQQAALWQ